MSIQKNDFVELKYTGYVNGKVFDSNIEGDLKELGGELKPRKTIVVVGQEMVVKGLDDALVGKEIGKEYSIIVKPKDGFGERRRELVKTIPLKVFTEKDVAPYPGMVLTLDDIMARIITISGARVVTDFNNPLSGKELNYKFIIMRKVEEEKEKAEALFDVFFKFIPEYEIKKPATRNGLLDAQDAKHLDIKEKIVIKGQKNLGVFVNAFNDKFKELLGKELGFEEKIEKKDDLEKKIADKKEEKDKEEKDK